MEEDLEEALQKFSYEDLIGQLMNFEGRLYKKTAPFEIKAAQYWGALIVLNNAKVISWDDTRRLFGEFCSKDIVGLRS